MTIKFRPGISSAHICLITAADGHVPLKLNSLGYFEKHGLNVLVFSNWYDGNFSDAKISGVELIHRGVRTATNGDVRMKSTPA
jgi:endoglucanase